MKFDLYLVTDERIQDKIKLYEIVEKAVEGGVNVVQLREKNTNTRDFIKKAIELKNILKKYHVPLIINDRIDIALAVEADGVHFGQKDMPYEYFMKLLPKYMIVGLSIENIIQLREAENMKIDYVALSPVFKTPTKTDFNEEPWGIEGLMNARSLTSHKIVAIGNINTNNAGEVIKAGADGIAVVSAICSAPDPKQAAKELSEIININKKR